MSKRRRDYRRWYEFKSVEHDFASVEETAAWLLRVVWQVYGTFTFAWAVSDGQANKVFAAFINYLERELGAPIAFVRGDEKRWSGCGMPASPRHFHVLMASTAKLDPQRLMRVWRRFGGSGRLKLDGFDYAYDSAKVMDRFDPRQKLEYSLKFINETDGDWAHRNLHYFVSDETPVGHRAKRRAARQARRIDGTFVRGVTTVVPSAGRWRPALAAASSLRPRLCPRRAGALPTSTGPRM